MHRNETKEATREIAGKRRDKANYNADVVTQNPTETGVVEYSPLNEIPFFHVTDSSAEDNTHIVDEGILHYNLLPSLYYFIYEQKFFTLQKLNDCLKLFDFNEDERQNIPSPITQKQLKEKEKLRMSASEMNNFAHNLVFIIGNLVPAQDPVWKFVQTTIRFFDLSYLPCYEDEDILLLADTIATMHQLYQNLFETALKPVHHLAIHYPNDTLNFGPLRYLRTIR